VTQEFSDTHSRTQDCPRRNSVLPVTWQKKLNLTKRSREAISTNPFLRIVLSLIISEISVVASCFAIAEFLTVFGFSFLIHIHPPGYCLRNIKQPHIFFRHAVVSRSGEVSGRVIKWHIRWENWLSYVPMTRLHLKMWKSRHLAQMFCNDPWYHGHKNLQCTDYFVLQTTISFLSHGLGANLPHMNLESWTLKQSYQIWQVGSYMFCCLVSTFQAQLSQTGSTDCPRKLQADQQDLEYPSAGVWWSTCVRFFDSNNGLSEDLLVATPILIFYTTFGRMRAHPQNPVEKIALSSWSGLHTRVPTHHKSCDDKSNNNNGDKLMLTILMSHKWWHK
jgi:hypothetical protein